MVNYTQAMKKASFFIPNGLVPPTIYSWDHSAFFFSAKAVIPIMIVSNPQVQSTQKTEVFNSPIFWSLLPKSAWNNRLSYSTPSLSDNS